MAEGVPSMQQQTTDQVVYLDEHLPVPAPQDPLTRPPVHCDSCRLLLGGMVVAVLLMVLAVVVLPTVNDDEVDLLIFHIWGVLAIVGVLAVCLIIPFSIYAGIPPLPSSATACHSMIGAPLPPVTALQSQHQSQHQS